MSKIIISDHNRLEGEVVINGAKNSVLPILAATLLTDEKCIISSIPKISDINNMTQILKYIGSSVVSNKESFRTEISGEITPDAPYELMNKLRASFLIAGPLLGRYGEARLYLPGGCAIGARPVDLHLKGFFALGAHISQEHGYISIKSDGLIGTKIYLDFPSVGATENLMMAAVFAKGQTVLQNAAVEPEIVDLANFLNAMGADIAGAGTDTIRINYVEKLKGAQHTVIPDRIEAGTYMVAAAITKGHIKIDNVICDHLKPVTAKLREIGAVIEERENAIVVNGEDANKPSDIKTLPYPGFPTDMQAQFSSYLSSVNGTSIITETIFENRFMHIAELTRMGANIKVEGRTAVIEGNGQLSGAKVKATDLRAGAALVLAGLRAEGETIIEDAEHITRGYNNFIDNLKNLGASIEKES